MSAVVQQLKQKYDVEKEDAVLTPTSQKGKKKLMKKMTRKGTMSISDPNEAIYNDLMNNPLEYKEAIE